MMPSPVFGRFTLIATLCSATLLPIAASAQEPFDAPPGQEVLTQGPVHESFAQPVIYDPRPGPIIPQAPPAPIEELPPEQRPEGANVRWIPGYWSWDAPRRDFLWISGVWRNIPPGRQWVPGYWAPVPGGSQWVAGAWTSAQAEPGAYLPTPPASLETGPNSPAPGPEAVWAPGCWIWQDVRFFWRPGFWVAPQPNWIWVPAQYAWTPGGFLFCEGYWDRPFALRGQLFAPVYFREPVYTQPAFVFQPTIGIVATALLGSLFVCPTLGVYYFGDYYAPGYFGVGIYPWYSFHQSRFGYDPLFSYYSVTYRETNPRWGAQLREEYLFRRDHPDARPPRTYAESVRVERRGFESGSTRHPSLAEPISRIAASGNPAVAPMRFARVEPAQRRQFAEQARQVHEFRQERSRVESPAARGRLAEEANRPRAIALPRSPIVASHPALAHPGGQALAPHNIPPASPTHPRLDHGPDPRAEARPALRQEPHPDAIHAHHGEAARPPEPRREAPRREPARAGERKSR